MKIELTRYEVLELIHELHYDNPTRKKLVQVLINHDNFSVEPMNPKTQNFTQKTCGFTKYEEYRCENIVVFSQGFCEEHIHAKCSVCNNQATWNCGAPLQFICGQMFCENHSHIHTSWTGTIINNLSEPKTFHIKQ